MLFQRLKKGIQHLPPLKVMVSDVAHYSIKKVVNLAGLGTDCLVNVKTDKTGRMCP
jgi:glutamate/tyrosine decarboxylase-like PLP-dependent enzyme